MPFILLYIILEGIVLYFFSSSFCSYNHEFFCVGLIFRTLMCVYNFIYFIYIFCTVQRTLLFDLIFFVLLLLNFLCISLFIFFCRCRADLTNESDEEYPVADLSQQVIGYYFPC